MDGVLIRTIRPGDYGKDVEAVTRAFHRLLKTGRLDEFRAKPTWYRRTFNESKVLLSRRAAMALELPPYGIVGPHLDDALLASGSYDAFALMLAKEYEDAHMPKLIEPRQGFQSLHRSLWSAYSIGISRGFTDLGTYADKPGDHGVWPSFAFDLGIEPDTGWQNLKARKYVLEISRRPEVEYVILGDRIYFGTNWRGYSLGGHYNHIHVSGVR